MLRCILCIEIQPNIMQYYFETILTSPNITMWQNFAKSGKIKSLHKFLFSKISLHY